MSLYYTPNVWEGMQTHVDPVVEFFRDYDTVRAQDGRTYFCVRGSDRSSLRALAELVKSGSRYVTQPLTAPKTLQVNQVTSVTDVPWWCVLLTREDLLWAATNRRGKELLRSLWSRRARGVTGRRFDDALAEDILRCVWNSTGTVVPQGCKWADGALVEIPFHIEDHDDITDILHELDEAMADTCVVTDGRSVTGVANRLDGYVEVTGKMVEQEDTASAVVVPFTSPRTLKFRNIKAWSAPILRGFCITATQAAVLCGLAAHEDLTSLKHVLDSCSMGAVPDPTVQDFMTADKRDLEWYVMAQDRGFGASVGGPADDGHYGRRATAHRSDSPTLLPSPRA